MSNKDSCKGNSFNNLTQEDITLVINHINSTARTSLNESYFCIQQLLETIF